NSVHAYCRFAIAIMAITPAASFDHRLGPRPPSPDSATRLMEVPHRVAVAGRSTAMGRIRERVAARNRGVEMAWARRPKSVWGRAEGVTRGCRAGLLRCDQSRIGPSSLRSHTASPL